MEQRDGPTTTANVPHGPSERVTGEGEHITWKPQPPGYDAANSGEAGESSDAAQQREDGTDAESERRPFSMPRRRWDCAESLLNSMC